MRETEKIWMNGELVDWGDARIHVGSHGLHYGTGVFEGIRCYETPKGPAVFRLTDHLQRLHNSARLLYMDIPFSVEQLREASFDLIGANGLPECYLRPIAFYGYGELGVSTAGNPVETVIMSWPWGTYLGDEGLKNGIRAKVSSWKRIGPEHDPARRQGDRRLPQLHARGHGGEPRRLRRGDPAHRRGLRRRRLGREHLRRLRRQDRHARALDLDPAGHHARLDHPDRAGSRPHCRRAQHHPLRPVPRGRDLHGRHGGRGDADPVGRRPRDRPARPRHAEAPEGLSRHGSRRRRALGQWLEYASIPERAPAEA